MSQPKQNPLPPIKPACCPCGCGPETKPGQTTRRGFLGGVGAAAFGGMAVTGLSWSSLSAAEAEIAAAPARRPLVVKPILTYPIATRKPQTSWRNWGGIQTKDDVDRDA